MGSGTRLREPQISSIQHSVWHTVSDEHVLLCKP